MNIKTLSPHALSVIDQYKSFSIGKAVCSIPYFNNKTIGSRGALRVYAGKGSPKDIYEETIVDLTKDHVPIDVLSDESLKKYLTDKNIGIDCSGFAYYILNAENEERDKGHLDKRLRFISCHGLLGKIRCAMRPVENCDVATLADNKNSKIISLEEVQPGDMVTMIAKANNRDHILVIHGVEYQEHRPTRVLYSHAIAYPEDGVYGTGVRQGSIEINDLEKTVLEGVWSEQNLLMRAKDYEVEVRRLNWL